MKRRNILFLLLAVLLTSCGSQTSSLDFGISLTFNPIEAKSWCEESFMQSFPEQIDVVEPYVQLDYFNSTIFSKRVHSDVLTDVADKALRGAIAEYPLLSSSRIIRIDDSFQRIEMDMDLLDVIEQMEEDTNARPVLPLSIKSYMQEKNLPYAMFIVLQGHEPKPHHGYGSTGDYNGCITRMKVLVADVVNDGFVYFGKAKHEGRSSARGHQRPTDQHELLCNLEKALKKYPAAEE